MSSEMPSDLAHGWSVSWSRCIRGRVVSEHAQRLITNFLTATLARTAGDDESTDEEDGAMTQSQDEIKPLCPNLDELHKILRGQAGIEQDNAKLSKTKREHARTIQRGRSMWSSLSSGQQAGTGALDTAGNKPSLRVKDHRWK